jgi:hypothetical protein
MSAHTPNKVLALMKARALTRAWRRDLSGGRGKQSAPMIEAP